MTMVDTKLHNEIDEFLRGDLRNAWLRGDYLAIYLRKSSRVFFRGERTACIDLANVEEMPREMQLQGIFPQMLGHLESKGMPVYAENILTAQLAWYLVRRGYERCNPMSEGLPCFVLMPNNKTE